MFGPGGNIRIIGHRGARGVAPENTVAAIRHGVEVGAQAIEIDLHVSADGELVVIHDPTLDRTTNGTISSESMPATGSRLTMARPSRSGTRTCGYRRSTKRWMRSKTCRRSWR
jgi:glycerophosphoryl diester phosphodiesterase